MNTRAIFRFLLLFICAIALTMLWVGSSSQLEQHSPAVRQLDSVPTQRVTHALGQVNIPLHPQRIVVLDSSALLDSVLALGVKPVGFAACSGCPENHAGIPQELIQDLEPVGTLGQPSLEKLLYLKPDLILAEKWHADIYPQLAAIAPTVIGNFASGVDFDLKRDLPYLAQILDRREQAEQILAQYQARVSQLREQLAKQLKHREIAIFQFLAGHLVSWQPDQNCYEQTLEDAGLEFVQFQKQQQQVELEINVENLPQYDAEIIFIVIADAKDAKNPELLSFLKQPIWSTLKAVQQKQVYPVQWEASSGPRGANQVMNDLYKYLLASSPKGNND